MDGNLAQKCFLSCEKVIQFPLHSLEECFEPLSLCFDQNADEIFFKISDTTKMSKVFETHAQRKGVRSTAMRFLLNGKRIDPTQTAKMLELEDQDQIDCVLEMVGAGAWNDNCHNFHKGKLSDCEWATDRSINCPGHGKCVVDSVCGVSKRNLFNHRRRVNEVRSFDLE